MWLTESAPALDTVSDLLAPIGGAALIALCLRLAITAYKDALTVCRDRETTCVTTLAAMTDAQRALTSEVQAASQDERTWRATHDQRMGHVERALAEIAGSRRHVDP